MIYCVIDFGMFNFVVVLFDGDGMCFVFVEGDYLMLFIVIFFNNDEEMVEYGWVVLVFYIDGFDGWLMCLMKSIFGLLFVEMMIDFGDGSVIVYIDIIVCFLMYLKCKVEVCVGVLIGCVVFGWLVFFVDDDLCVDWFV